MNLEGKRIIVSRTDSIGDVMLTLPVCHWLKHQFPSCHVIFLGKSYTRAVVEAYQSVDQFEDWATYQNVPKTEKIQQFRTLKADIILHIFPDKEIASLAKKARIPMRVGTSHRSFHLLTCSHRVNFSRRSSPLHESQLNYELLRPLGLTEIPTLGEVEKSVMDFIPSKETLPEPFESLTNYIILHPKSQGSAREWPIEKYMGLAVKLADTGRNVVFTGTENEGELFRQVLPENERIFDSTGKLTLQQLITCIRAADGLVACSTGPLHIAGFSGIKTIGLFSPKRPIHPGRWKALGPKVTILVDENCKKCDKKEVCSCMEEIEVQAVLDALTS